MRHRHTVALAIGLVAVIGVSGALAAEHPAVVAKKNTVVNDSRGDSNLAECDVTKVTVKQKGKKKLQFKIKLAGERRNVNPPIVNLKIGSVRDTVSNFDVTSGTVKFKDQPADQVTYTFKAKDFGISKKFKWQVEQCTPLGSPQDDFVPDSGMKKGKLKK